MFWISNSEQLLTELGELEQPADEEALSPGRAHLTLCWGMTNQNVLLHM